MKLTNLMLAPLYLVLLVLMLVLYAPLKITIAVLRFAVGLLLYEVVDFLSHKMADFEGWFLERMQLFNIKMKE